MAKSDHTSIRFFTLEEANALLPKIRPLMAQLIERQARVGATYQQLDDLLEHASQNVGSLAASKMAQDFVMIERLVKEIRAFGCHVKDIKVGLVDFLTEINGREVYLCWRYGEKEITHYHDFNAGFQGRKRIKNSDR